MVTEKLKELEATRAKLAALEQSVAAELKSELAALPARFGFSNTADFFAAVQAASGKRRGRKPGSGKSASAEPAVGKRRKRAKITDKTRTELKKLVEQGKTGTEIAAALKISLPSVQNIKKALGLVGKGKTGRKAKPRAKSAGG